MNEFNLQGETPISTPRPASSAPQSRYDWLSRPVLLGLSPPWLAGCGLVLVLAGWYLLAPAGVAMNNELARIDDGGGLQPVASDFKADFEANEPSSNGFGISQLKQEVVEMVTSVRAHSEANRTAIEHQAQTIKAQAAQLAPLQQQLVEAQAQISVLSARLSSLESKPAMAQKRVRTTAAVKSSSPLSGMRVSAVQIGMAWVYWQDKTWAVQVGDSLGPVTVTGIDADSREVFTSAGTLR